MKAPRSISANFHFIARKDGGPYIGSGSIVVMRDPDSNRVNASIYRVQVHGKNQVTVQFDHPGRHGAIIAKKCWDRGEPCPIAVVNGEDPALHRWFSVLSRGLFRIRFPRRNQRRADRTVPGSKTGLPIPIHAEMILGGMLYAPSTKH